jgi:hypothetical protein
MAAKNIKADDAIHGLGLVTLWSAYAEEGVDQLLEFLSSIDDFDDRTKCLPIGRKLEHALKVVERLDCSELAGLCSVRFL